MKKLLLALTVALCALPLTASAQVKHHPVSINHRQAVQNRRIHQGVKHGSLTWREAARIRAREASIRARERRDRRKGHGLSGVERARLQRSLNHTSKAIHRQKHDRQHRH